MKLTLHVTSAGLLALSATSASADWLNHGAESAFGVPGTYSSYTENSYGYGFSVWCVPEGLLAAFDTTEVLEVGDTDRFAASPTVLLIRADSMPPRYYVAGIESSDRRLRVSASIDPEAVRQIGQIREHLSVAVMISGSIYHEQTFDALGAAVSISRFVTSCKLATS